MEYGQTPPVPTGKFIHPDHHGALLYCAPVTCDPVGLSVYHSSSLLRSDATHTESLTSATYIGCDHAHLTVFVRDIASIPPCLPGGHPLPPP